MLGKILGVVLLVVGASIGLSILVALIGTAIGLLWFLVRLAVPIVLIYIGYRLCCSDRSRYA